jgi:hypothetical protein
MDYQIKEIMSFLPREMRNTPWMEKVISVILSYFVYLKKGDRILVPGIEVEKLPDGNLSIKSEVDFNDIIKLFKENKLG